jgi:peptide/nickel transport system ATP-binding protein
VAYACDRVAVMYLGQVVEIAPTDKLYYSPQHPYTEALMSAIPEADPSRVMKPVYLTGERPSPMNPPAGCRFHTRCQYATSDCKTQVPALREIKEDHFVACIHAEQLTLKGALEHGKGMVERPAIRALP